VLTATLPGPCKTPGVDPPAQVVRRAHTPHKANRITQDPPPLSLRPSPPPGNRTRPPFSRPLAVPRDRSWLCVETVLRVVRTRWALFADRSVDQLPYDVQVPDMPGVLLQQMRKDPAKGGWIAGEPATQSAPIGQLRLPGNRLSTGSDCGQVVPSGREHCPPARRANPSPSDSHHLGDQTSARPRSPIASNAAQRRPGA
jgi:hypothetical protein